MLRANSGPMLSQTEAAALRLDCETMEIGDLLLDCMSGDQSKCPIIFEVNKPDGIDSVHSGWVFWPLRGRLRCSRSV